MIGAMGLAAAGSAFCWFQIVNNIMMKIFIDSWQLVHSMMQNSVITWILPLLGQYSIAKGAGSPANNLRQDVNITISVDEGCPSPDSGMDSPPAYESTFEEQDKKE